MPSPEALVVDERIKKKIPYQERSETEIAGSHRELEAIYHFLNKDKKAELVEQGAKEAFNYLGIHSILDAEEFPSGKEKFSDIQQTEGPQVFTDIIGNGEVLVAVRLNNGKPNTMMLFSAHPNESGKVNLNLSEEDSLVHVCTEEDVDAARTKFLSRSYHSMEGKWMRGKISSGEYKKEFERVAEMPLAKFHEMRDKTRKEDKITQLKSYRAHRNLEILKDEFEDELLISMWEEEDEVWEARQAKIKKAQELARKALWALKDGISDLAEMGARLPGDIMAAVGERVWEFKESPTYEFILDKLDLLKKRLKEKVKE